VTKGEERRDFLLVVPAVSHVDALGEHDVGTVAKNTLRVPGKWRLVTAGRPGDWEPSGWIGLAKQEPCRGGAPPPGRGTTSLESL
jgi:hypothetical protein